MSAQDSRGKWEIMVRYARYVSGANFFGEILEWTGFAIAAGSLPVSDAMFIKLVLQLRACRRRGLSLFSHSATSLHEVLRTISGTSRSSRMNTQRARP